MKRSVSKGSQRSDGTRGQDARGGATGGATPKKGKLSFPPGEESEVNPWRRAALALDKAKEPPVVRDEPDMCARSDGKVAIGRLGAPRGISGDLRVQSYSGETSHILSLKTVELVREKDGLPETRLHLRVSRSEEGPGGLTLAFEGYAMPERATLLAGMEILVDKGLASPLGDNEWYTTDLVGLRLVSPDKKTSYGIVRAVCEGGSDPWLELDRGEGFKEAQRPLVPFRKEFVGEIDLAGGWIELLAPWILE
ncbi:MAG: ribosome maturation factor RimM [Spirochaetota bacterium]